MPSKILLRRSILPGAAPTTTDLSLGELAINPEDKKLYFKDSSNNIQHLKSLYASSISDLADVDTQSAGPQDGDGLVWDLINQKWVPSSVSPPLTIENTDQLGNITITVDNVSRIRFDGGFRVTDLGNGTVKLGNLAELSDSFGNLDAGLPDSNYGGIEAIECGGVSR